MQSKDLPVKTGGIKHDHGKPRPDLILHTMARAMLAVSEVAAFGASKYDDDNWLLVDDANRRYADAKARHMLQGAIESHDKESGLLHAAHETWNALALLELKLRERERLGGRACTDAPITPNWPADADERIDVIGQNGNDGEHYGDEMQFGHMLTIHDLRRGDWWCADTSEPARQAFALCGFNVADLWALKDLDGCRLTGKESVTRFKGMSKTKGLREITLIDGEFYYCKSQSLNEGEHYEDGLVWIEHDGTECPVGTESTVVVRLRCGVVNDPHLARLCKWRNVSDDYPFDITHYRIVDGV